MVRFEKLQLKNYKSVIFFLISKCSCSKPRCEDRCEGCLSLWPGVNDLKISLTNDVLLKKLEALWNITFRSGEASQAAAGAAAPLVPHNSRSQCGLFSPHSSFRGGSSRFLESCQPNISAPPPNQKIPNVV